MLLRLDELNTIQSNLGKLNDNVDAANELMTNWLLLAYADGKNDIEQQLGGVVKTAIDQIWGVIKKEIGGKDVFDRIEEYVYLEDIEMLVRLFASERERVYNTASYDTAKELGARYKTWHTMKDDKVRDSHYYLDEVTKPIDEEYHTIWGNSGQHPGAFNDASENANCRCYCTYK